MSLHQERNEDGFLFSTDRSRVDIDLVHAFLSGESYWVRGIRRKFVERAIDHSICFGVYENERQVAFARVISDCAGFAWLADVFVVAGHRGTGIGKRLIAFVLEHPDLQHIRRFMLATRDAHGLYEGFGFTPLAHSERLMERYDADALSR